MKIYFACLPTLDHQRVLAKADAKNRLISYIYLKDKRGDFLRDLVETGLTDNVEGPDEPMDEIPLDVQIIFGDWWKNGKV
jgi:hypothetical protein